MAQPPTIARVAQPARRPDDVPVVDPGAVAEAYRRERARRRARLARQRASHEARIRFLAVVGFLLIATIVLVVTIWHQVQQLFGL
jgi:hypothetical protein